MTKKLQFVLLLLLSMTSVYFAEVIAGSSKFPFYDFWGIVVVLPLYGLHTIVLLYIIKRYVRNRRVLFATLYFAGTIFGLYEAYLTKVLWVGLSPDSAIFFHIAWMDFVVLVFLWHPIFAFIIPVLVFERFMTKDNYIYEGLPPKIKYILGKKSIIVFIAILFGVFMALNSVGPIELFLSGTLNAIPIILLYYLLRRNNIHRKYTLEEILPDSKNIKICIGILIFMYIIMGIFIKGEVLNIANQLVIWGLYIIFSIVLFFKIKYNQNISEDVNNKKEITLKVAVIYLVIFLISGSLTTMLWGLGIRDVFMMTIWITWIVIGIILFTMTLLKSPR